MEYFFETREAASAAAAARIAESLSRRLGQQQAASLVVSGGSTPARCFAALAHTPIDWGRVYVLLSDERWVPPIDEDSNERLVREKLLIGNASAATLVPAYAADETPVERCASLHAELLGLPFPFACALLGMGADGHFASLFPDAKNLPEGLDPDGQELWLPIQTEASEHPRISLTLAALSRSDDILLLMFGDDKMRTYTAAKGADSPLPVSRLLRQKRATLSVYWAP